MLIFVSRALKGSVPAVQGFGEKYAQHEVERGRFFAKPLVGLTLHCPTSTRNTFALDTKINSNTRLDAIKSRREEITAEKMQG
ncbi:MULTISPECIES: hypothetical protein [Dysgonomonadaceae]|jgi:hypothetical protein|uniref:hypothetical protein n=1 Tax=Dysgonomonadaceae TaxID=2005520 RepID=UPI000E8F4638|nr:hypothetical protein [Proteiniphilum sp. UBA5259]HBC37846.1 hypothetical protein [Porphyromonadaceae bacterium]